VACIRPINLSVCFLLVEFYVIVGQWIWATRVRFPDIAGHFRCDWSWNYFYGNRTIPLLWNLQKLLVKAVVLINCLTAWSGTTPCMAELCSGEFKLIRRQQLPPPPKSGLYTQLVILRSVWICIFIIHWTIFYLSKVISDKQASVCIFNDLQYTLTDTGAYNDHKCNSNI
jgi:hypothetical protein